MGGILIQKNQETKNQQWSQDVFYKENPKVLIDPIPNVTIISGYTYEAYNLTEEINIVINKEEVIVALNNSSSCQNENLEFDIQDTDSIKLKIRNGEMYWSFQEYAGSKSTNALINADSGEVISCRISYEDE